jgi:hypothetical protein
MAFKGMGLSVIKKSPLCFWQKTFKFSFNKGRYTVYKGQSCRQAAANPLQKNPGPPVSSK